MPALSSAAFSCASAWSPGRRVAHVTRRASWRVRRRRQPEVAVDPLHQANQPLDLFADLLLRHEAVGIVLRELAHARQAGQHARCFVAVQRRLLVKPQRAGRDNCAPRSRTASKCPGQFIGFTLIVSSSDVDEEHVLPIVLPVPRRLPQRLVEDQRRLHFDIARWETAPRACNCQAGCRASCPFSSQNVAPGAHGWNSEQPELAAEFPVVAFLRFFDLRQVRLQLFVAEERRAVNPLHRLIARIAFPVGVRRAQQLERLQPAAGRHVRADAEVDEQVAVLDRVDRDLFLALRLLLDELHLQRLAAIAEEPRSPRRAATSDVRRRNRRPRFPSSSSRWRRDLPARRDAGRRSRRRTLRRSEGRCRIAPTGRAASRRPPAGAPCCGGRPSGPPDPCS